MARHEFILKLNRPVTDEEIDALYEAGCSDASVETGPVGALVDFSREAPTLPLALVSAVRDIEKVVGLRAVGVACDSMVTQVVIAERVGVSREAVRLWATGQRGPGGFPPPVLVTAGGEQIWDWQQVATWLSKYREPQPPSAWQVSVRSRTLCVADRVLAARDALLGEPDPAAREEFERLLADA
jgi:hypothetical protein